MAREKHTFRGTLSPRTRLVLSVSGVTLGIGIGVGMTLLAGRDAAIGNYAVEHHQPAEEIDLLNRAVAAEFIAGSILAGISVTKGGDMVGAAWRDFRTQKQGGPEEQDPAMHSETPPEDGRDW